MKKAEYSQENTCIEVSFLKSCSHSTLQLYLKKTPTQVFSSEYCEIFKRPLLTEILIYFVFPYRSEVTTSIKKYVLQNFTEFTGKHLSKCLFFNRVAVYLKRRLWRKCFPINFEEQVRTAASDGFMNH